MGHFSRGDEIMKPIYNPKPIMFVPMRKQPPEKWDMCKPIKNDSGDLLTFCFYSSKDNYDYGYVNKAPYHPGEICYVKETWRHIGNVQRTGRYVQAIIEYSDGTTKHCGEWPDFLSAPKEKWWNTGKEPWESPVTMPEMFARKFIKIISIEPMRINQITPHDAILAGYPGMEETGLYPQAWFRQNWHLKHPNKEWAWRIESHETALDETQKDLTIADEIQRGKSCER